MNYPLASTTWDQDEIKAMHKVIESGLFTMGQHVAKFESDFSSYFGSPYSVMVNSGSSANLLAIAALFYRKNNPLKVGDEVIVPAVSWATTFHPLQQFGLHCKFVDIDLLTLNYDLLALNEAVSDKTRMIVAVNLLGNPNEFDTINKIINGRDIIIMEDNCESMGASYNGKMAGTYGLIGTYSSFFSHHISTMEGGMIVTSDEELYHILLSLRSHGWTRNLPKYNKVTGEKSDDEFEESYKFVLPGYNVRPGELHGVLGIEQLKKLPSIIEERRNNAVIFKNTLNSIDWILTQKEIDQSSWFGFSMILKDNAPVDRAEFVKLLRGNAIECRPIVSGNFLKNPVMKYYKHSTCGQIKNAEILDSRGLFIGNHHYNLHAELAHLKNVLEKVQ